MEIDGNNNFESSGNNGKAIASLVVSCIGVLNCCAWYLAILLGVTGIVLGILALRGENRRQMELAVAGIVVGAAALAMGVAIAVLIIPFYAVPGDPSIEGMDDAAVLFLYKFV